MKRILASAVICLITGLTAAHAADAKALWDKDCAKCHGKEGKGDTKMGKKLGALDYTDPKVQAKMTDAEMIKVIKEGSKKDGKTLMKAYPELSDAEVKDLVAFIRKLKK